MDINIRSMMAFDSFIKLKYQDSVLWNHGKPTHPLYIDLWDSWKQSQKVAVPDRHLVVNKGDYVELVKTNRERQETIARLTEEVKIIRERKKFYKNKCKSLIPEGYVVVPKEPTWGMTDGGCSAISHGRTNEENVNRIYKAMIEAVEKNDE